MKFDKSKTGSRIGEIILAFTQKPVPVADKEEAKKINNKVVMLKKCF